MIENEESAPKRLAWGLSEIANATGLSLGFLRNEVRAERLPIRRFGRRVVVRDEDLRAYLESGSDHIEQTRPSE